METSPDPATRSEKSTKRRHSRSARRSNSSSSSSSRGSRSSSQSSSRSDRSSGKLSHGKNSASLLKLPFEARDLPHPHEFVFPKARLGPNGKSKKKITAFDITFDDFWAGSLTILNCLVCYQKHHKTAKEFVDYLEYFATKLEDYYARAVMQFDEDFRGPANFEMSQFDNVALRKTCGTSYFHAHSFWIAKITPTSSTVSYLTAFQPSAATVSRPANIHICDRFNSTNGCNIP